MFALGAARFRFAQVENDVLALDALHRRIQYFLLAMRILVEDRVALRLAHLLEDHLLGKLRGDAAQRRGIAIHTDLAADFDSGRKLVRLLQRDLIHGIFEFIVGGNNGLEDVGGDLTRIFVQFSAHVLLGLVILARGQGDRLFHGTHHDLGLNALFATQEFDTLI